MCVRPSPLSKPLLCDIPLGDTGVSCTLTHSAEFCSVAGNANGWAFTLTASVEICYSDCQAAGYSSNFVSYRHCGTSLSTPCSTYKCYCTWSKDPACVGRTSYNSDVYECSEGNQFSGFDSGSGSFSPALLLGSVSHASSFSGPFSLRHLFFGSLSCCLSLAPSLSGSPFLWLFFPTPSQGTVSKHFKCLAQATHMALPHLQAAHTGSAQCRSAACCRLLTLCGHRS